MGCIYWNGSARPTPDLEVPRDVRDVPGLRQEPIRFPQLADDLLRRVPPPFTIVMFLPPPTIAGNGLSSRVV